MTLACFLKSCVWIESGVDTDEAGVLPLESDSLLFGGGDGNEYSLLKSLGEGTWPRENKMSMNTVTAGF